MERLHIYIIIGLIFVVYIFALLIIVKRSYPVDDDLEFNDEDGDHIYYDRKLIRHKRQCTRKNQN